MQVKKKKKVTIDQFPNPPFKPNQTLKMNRPKEKKKLKNHSKLLAKMWTDIHNKPLKEAPEGHGWV